MSQTTSSNYLIEKVPVMCYCSDLRKGLPEKRQDRLAPQTCGDRTLLFRRSKRSKRYARAGKQKLRTSFAAKS